ncbi:MAG: DUF4401 domain-containing protein [Variovorax sp.]|nr:MAG: DUF4401 domain-containing protein [Variovorax sp.]
MSAPASVLQRAIDQGLLPADAEWPREDTRPWPVLMLTALGAWLVVVPLIGVIALTFGDALLREGPALYVFGIGLLVFGVVISRQRGLALFVEQLFMPALMLGLGCLGGALLRDVSISMAALALGVTIVVLAVFTPLGWLRTLLGFLLAACVLVFTVAATQPDTRGWDLLDVDGLQLRAWQHVHFALLVWLAVIWALPRMAGARLGGLIDSMADGWCAHVLWMLALLAGNTFLVGGMVAGGGFGQTTGMAGGVDRWQTAVSLACGVAAVVLLGRRWTALRASPVLGGGVALLLVVLCGFLPGLGAACLCTAALAVTGRWPLAGLGSAAVLWIVGSFYYALAWPLADKALLLAGIGAALGALAWAARYRATRDPASPSSPDNHAPASSRWPALIALAGVATLAVASGAIFQKENILRDGQPVFVRLAPVDPRSLMQGDYMALDFALPGDLRWEGGQHRGERPLVLLRPDPALPSTYTLVEADRGTPRQPGDLAVPLSPKDGRWVFVTDAWFFKEGDAAKFETARYGEFRILPNGSALLVGMADEHLQPLR